MNTLIAVIPIIAACVSVWFAIVSARAAKKSLALSEQQEARRQPALNPYLIKGYFKKLKSNDSKIFAFSMSVSNATDTDNAIVLLELEVSYVSTQNACMKVKVPHEVDLVKDFGGGEINPFNLPTSIMSHQAVAGWALFNVSDALLNEGILDSYTIVLTDSHGLVTRFDPGIPKEIKDV